MDEETGLTGANNLQPGFVRSGTLLNLDSEDEGELYVGCSGGRDNTGTWTAEYDDAPTGGTGLLVTVKGLKGGHSGLEIHTGRGNALKMITRVLLALQGMGARVARVEGGNKRNAIPREAEAVGLGAQGEGGQGGRVRRDDARGDRGGGGDGGAEPRDRLRAGQKGVRKVLKRALQKKVLLTLAGLPHGVLRMSADIPGLVETSSNLAIMQTSRKDGLDPDQPAQLRGVGARGERRRWSAASSSWAARP